MIRGYVEVLRRERTILKRPAEREFVFFRVEPFYSWLIIDVTKLLLPFDVVGGTDIEAGIETALREEIEIERCGDVRVKVDIQIAKLVHMSSDIKETVLGSVEALDLVEPWSLGELALHRVTIQDQSVGVVLQRRAVHTSNHGICKPTQKPGRPLSEGLPPPVTINLSVRVDCKITNSLPRACCQ